MNIAVAWDETAWRALYPQFAGITSAQLEALWKMATAIIDNAADSPIPYDPDSGIYARQIILFALMCHLATLATQDQSGQPGTLTSASEGSVSTGFYMPSFPGSGVAGAWYNQTPCGRTVFTLLRRFALGGVYYPCKTMHPFG